jgi:hypothetical protein
MEERYYIRFYFDKDWYIEEIMDEDALDCMREILNEAEADTAFVTHYDPLTGGEVEYRINLSQVKYIQSGPVHKANH